MQSSLRSDLTEGKGERTSKHLIADEDYCRTLASNFGIAERDVMDALLGEPMKRALRVCGWAESVETSPLRRGQALDRWAKKNKSGVYRGVA
jgi:hypothetical protein